MKSAVDQLAIFGGTPAFSEPVHVGRPNVGDQSRLTERIHQLLARRWLTNDGPFLREFEQRLAETLGVRHCVAVANGTLGLELTVRALRLTGEVILPSFTFAGTAHALSLQGITPVFCDIDPTTHNIDPRRVEELITPRTSGILGVHLWGRCCDHAALDAIAKRRGLALIYDAAHAFGCFSDGVPVARLGTASVLSFHATKIVNSFEGGAVVTNVDELADQVRLSRSFGFLDVDKVVDIGLNAKMSEASAAMGLTSLESLDDFVAHSQRNHELYSSLLRDVQGVSVRQPQSPDRPNFHYVVLEIDESHTEIGRDSVLAALEAEQILARRYFYPGCHRMQPYSSLRTGPLFNTEALCERVLQLPTGTAIGPDAIAEITAIIRLVVENAPAVAGRLKVRSLGK